jgi:hypothetical protein
MSGLVTARCHPHTRHIPRRLPEDSPAATAESARDMLLGYPKTYLNPHKLELTEGNIHAEIVLMARANTDTRHRHVWAILIGLTAMAITVGLATIVIHDRIH